MLLRLLVVAAVYTPLCVHPASSTTEAQPQDDKTVLQQLKLISESLKVLVAEAGRQQSQINQLEEELSSMNNDYEDLKEDVANL
ncbi:hypothetical protein GBAR_LOCUS7343, partial [Geodia barretti]